MTDSALIWVGDAASFQNLDVAMVLGNGNVASSSLMGHSLDATGGQIAARLGTTRDGLSGLSHQHAHRYICTIHQCDMAPPSRSVRGATARASPLTLTSAAVKRVGQQVFVSWNVSADPAVQVHSRISHFVRLTCGSMPQLDRASCVLTLFQPGRCGAAHHRGAQDEQLLAARQEVTMRKTETCLLSTLGSCTIDTESHAHVTWATSDTCRPARRRCRRG